MLKTKFLLLFFLIGTVSFAQDFDAGFRLGIAGSQVNGDKLVGFNKAGIIAGAFVSRKLSSHFSVQMEMAYVQKGSRKPTSEIDNSFYLLRVNYIEIPLMLQWKVASKLALTAGSSFGTLISSHEENEWGVFDSGSQFKKFEVSANAGIVYSLGDHWSFDGRYSASMTTIRPFPGVATAFFDRGQYNELIEFSLLYRF